MHAAGGADATLVAVTKHVEPEVAALLARLELDARGACDLGESRVPEFERKVAHLKAAGLGATGLRWHFLGHLQRNKARRVVRLAHVLHSVDSLRLLDTLGRLAAEEGRCPQLFLQVKLTEEQTKGGLDPDELPAALSAAAEHDLSLLGLMGMAPLEPDPAQRRDRARTAFRRLAALARKLPSEVFVDGRVRLSMGMSGDFEDALSEGADCVRIGSLLFEGLPGRAPGALSGGAG